MLKYNRADRNKCFAHFLNTMSEESSTKVVRNADKNTKPNRIISNTHSPVDVKVMGN